MVALAVMAGALFFAMGDANAWLHLSLFKRLVWMAGLVLVGGASYFATLFLLGFRPRDYVRKVNH
jgi:putative peptidoglycan lipid II flippase